ncbi:hypothetical protein L7F22_040874 [Adiantum nelumboides]|nr:hypothetical protein [Adiantum nelumboides]
MAAAAPNWSSTLEDLLDDGDTEEAQRLLEGLVADLRARPDASTNLTLAAALSDLASLYHALGLSSRAHSASSSALLIKQTAQFCPPTAASSNSAGDHIPSETASSAPDEAQSIREEGPGAELEEGLVPDILGSAEADASSELCRAWGQPNGCQMRWELCPTVRIQFWDDLGLKTGEKPEITEAGYALFWSSYDGIGDKDSDLLKIPYLQIGLGRVLHRYAAQISPKQDRSCGIQVNYCTFHSVSAEWESLLSEETINLKALSLAKASCDSPSQEKTSFKQRGRGVFTRGEMGMYIDRLTTCSTRERELLDTMTEEVEQEEAVSNVQSKVTFGVRHVLVVSFSPSVTTRDLEELFKPFGSDGVAIRWVNDTTALAVFRNPETAKEALQSTRNPRFRVELLADDDTIIDLVKEQDLRPPVPRPATSSQAAHRMIMGALQRQGVKKISKESIAMTSFKSSQQQEAERKQRLHTRQKLRDEAWGADQ